MGKKLVEDKENVEIQEKKEQNKNKDVEIKNIENKKESEKEKNKKIKARSEEKKENTKDTKNKNNVKQDNLKSKDKEKNRKVKIFIVIAIIILIGIIVSTIFALLNINNQKIISGVSISGIEVSGLSKEEAKAKLEILYNEKREKDIQLKYEDYEPTLNPTIMEVNYDIDKAVEEAYLEGREDNIFINNYKILFTLIGKKNVNVDMQLNEDVTKQSVEDICVNIPGVVIESSYSVEEDELIITKGKPGVVIDTQKLVDAIKENLKDVNIKEKIIYIPVINKNPEEINIDKIHEEIYAEAKDAYYTKDPFTIYPEVDGVDFDVEAARALLAEDKEEYVIKLTITKPKVTISQIGSEAFPDQLSVFTTRFDESDVSRSTNLRIACQKINGKVVLAGETFSYNKALGARTAAAGYKNGKIYEGGKVVDGIGGGICQISSTLYNAILMANLETVERRNHQFVTSYVGPGRDATVVYGVTDFKFKNSRQFPVRIVATAKNGIATVAIYGIKGENEYTFNFSTKTVATIPSQTQYIEDAGVPAGTEKVQQKGANGIKTETYITKMLNGKVISTKLLSKDTYDAMERIVVKGIGGAQITPAEPAKAEEKPEQPVVKPEEEKPSVDPTQDKDGEDTIDN